MEKATKQLVLDYALQAFKENKSKAQVVKELQAKGYFKGRSFDAARFKLNRLLRNAGEEQTTETNQYPPPTVLSALDEQGRLMTVEEFCAHHNLPLDDIRSYKLVTHTGTPYYNIASQSRIKEDEPEFDIDSAIQRAVDRFSEELPKIPHTTHTTDKKPRILQIILSDIHVGMDPNPDGASLYGGTWGEKELTSRRDEVIRQVSKLNTLYDGFDSVQILELGDLTDGFDGKTTRGGHGLKQNMTDEEIFDVALHFKTKLLSDVVQTCGTQHIISYNVCNSNHSAAVDYMVNSAYEKIVKVLFKDVRVINEKRFIGHFHSGDWVEVLLHGKDKADMKFGLKPKLDERGVAYIDSYLKFNNLLGKNVTVHKGDSHSLLMDSCSSPDFSYHNYLSFAPSSGWVQNNFGKSRSGFTLIVKDTYGSSQAIHNYEFEWGMDTLK